MDRFLVALDFFRFVSFFVLSADLRHLSVTDISLTVLFVCNPLFYGFCYNSCRESGSKDRDIERNSTDDETGHRTYRRNGGWDCNHLDSYGLLT